MLLFKSFTLKASPIILLEQEEEIHVVNSSKYYAKFEPIVDENLQLFSSEILFRLEWEWNQYLEHLENLKKTNSTFWLFKRISSWAFEKCMNTGQKVNINIDVNDVIDIKFIDHIQTLLFSYKINPININFELLENTCIEEDVSDLFLSKIKTLSNMWFWFSIDDLYSWYSNKERIEYLLQNNIQISTVKIDWLFMRKIFASFKNWFKNANDNTKFGNLEQNEYFLFKKYLKYLKNNNIKLVAEHIETKEIFDFAKSLWFDYFQWYFIKWDNNFQQI